MELTESQKSLLIRIGTTLLLVQTVERMLRMTMTWVFQKRSPLTIEALEAQREAERKKTIGYFIAELKKRADVHPLLEANLSHFLTMRNQFVHNLSDIPGWDTHTEEGQKIALKFVNDLFHLSQALLKIFAALLRSWGEQIGSGVPLPDNEFFADVEANYKPLVDALFTAKE